MSDKKFVNVPGPIHSTTQDNVAMYSDELYDKTEKKKQNQINKDFKNYASQIHAENEELKDALENLNPDQTEALALSTKVNELNKSLGTLNINELNQQEEPYENATYARAAVPEDYRKLGLKITYLLEAGWFEEQFIGDDIEDYWSDDDNWQVIGPVNVTEDILIIGSKKIHIAGIGTQTEQNSLVGGFTPSPINFDNTNNKVVWDNPLYFRINGKTYTVAADNLLYSSYDGGQSALALVLELTDTEVQYHIYQANVAIVGNSWIVEPNVLGKYVVAWFYRSGSSWSDGGVKSVYSNLPCSINGIPICGQNVFAGNFALCNTKGQIIIDNNNKVFYFSNNFYIWRKKNRVFELVKYGGSTIAFPDVSGSLFAMIYDSNSNIISCVPQTNVKAEDVIMLFNGHNFNSDGIVDEINWCSVIYSYGMPKKDNEEEINLDDLVNRGITASGLGDVNAKRVSTETLLSVPYSGVVFKLNVINPMIVMGIRSGQYADNLNTNQYWVTNGGTITIPSTHNYYRISFAKLVSQSTPYEYEDISAEDFTNLFKGGSLMVTYPKKDADFKNRAYVFETSVKSALFKKGDATHIGVHEFPIFVHITDAHGDIVRIKNAIDYANEIQADAIFSTGDIIAQNVSNKFKALSEEMQKGNVPNLFCRGNHESYGNSDSSFDVYAEYYEALATKWNYLKTYGNVSDKTYYYMDFASKKIRVIALNQYEKTVVNIDSDTNNWGSYSQAQIDWFISTLLSTPQDYGVICIMHSPEAYPSLTPSLSSIEGHNKFFSSEQLQYWSTPENISGMPLRDIIDAFISKTTINSSFTQKIDGGTTETINVIGDFSSINNGVEFICWVCGHQHIDLVGKYESSVNLQTVILSTCTTAQMGGSSYPYLNNLGDLPRDTIGVIQDSFNVFAVDRTNGHIRIAKVGSNRTNLMEWRDCEIVPYK